MITRNLTMRLQTPTDQTRKRSDYYVEGYATTFEPYVLIEDDTDPIYEQVDRNAFLGTDMTDVILQFDHEGFVYARTSNDTLGLEVDDHGLLVWADLSKTSRGKQLYEDISSGMISKMSFRASCECDFDREADGKLWSRITKMKHLYDVSAVSIPANDGTEIQARAKKMNETALSLRKEKLKLKLKLEGE